MRRREPDFFKEIEEKSIAEAYYLPIDPCLLDYIRSLEQRIKNLETELKQSKEEIEQIKKQAREQHALILLALSINSS
jgi:predicted RNase H-like nuclease (RuvC/YqgF family)